MKLLKYFLPLLLIAVIYLVGPAPDDAEYDLTLPKIPAQSNDLEAYITTKESTHLIKPDNEARIIWADSMRNKTPYSVVYLHGFSASQEEGNPVHTRFARRFGCNLYLARLADHGIDTTEALMLYTAERAWASAKEALAIGNLIGDKTILISTSTGGTLALKLAAEFPERVHALINLSPNIAINNPAAFLLNDPWGLYIARMVMGGKYRDTGGSGDKAQYWNTRYRLEAVVQLQELIESTMHEETFSKITQPSLTLYYYKNEEEQDPEVMVSAMLEMHAMLATPDSLKKEKAIPSAGAHVIGGARASKDVDAVYNEMELFAEKQLQMKSHAVAIR